MTAPIEQPVELQLLPRPRRAHFSGRRVPASTVVVRRGSDHSLPAQGYRLTVAEDGTVSLDAADAAGRFYGEATLAQLVGIGTGQLPVGTVEDWPDLPVRGVMLDVSRCKVPTMDTLLDLVDRLASWKVNHFELYMEHTFAYAGHEPVWQDAGPYDEQDLTRLAAHCRDRHMALVPNQNCLGHMERWLLHERYAHLGIARGVVTGPLGMPMPASTLDPAVPGSLELVRELLGALGAALPGGQFHVGLDEPWDLGRARGGEWGGWLERIRGLEVMDGRQLLVWGDMLAAHPELAGRVPADVTVCEWGYEANHPFAARTARLADGGIAHWVAPGTSSWLSLLGRTTNALENCRAAAQAAAGSDAGGLLVTDWGDFGHLQYPAVSDPGLAAAAGLSWCAATNADLDAATVAGLLDRHCYGDAAGALGAAVVALGDAHTLQPVQVPNVSALALHLYFPQLPVGTGFGGGLTPADLDTVEGALASAVEALARARPTTPHGRLAVPELATSAAIVQLLCRDARGRLAGGGTLAGIPAPLRSGLAAELDDLVAGHRALWTTRNRPGGLDESARWLTHLGDCYRRGAADADWAGPLVERIRREHPAA